MNFNNKLFKKERLKHSSLRAFVKSLQKEEPKASVMLVQRWEKDSVPGGKYLMLICKILGKEPNYFFTNGVKKVSKKTAP